MPNIYYEPHGCSQNLLEKQTSLKEDFKKCTSFEEQNSARYIWENFSLALLFSADFCLQNCVSDFFSFVLLGR